MYPDKGKMKSVQQNLRGHDPYVVFLKLLVPLLLIPGGHIHVPCVLGHTKPGMLSQHLSLLQARGT